MSFHTTQGIVLRAIPFKDNQKIATVFTQDLGLISMLLKKASPRSGLLSFTETFCEAEFVLQESRSDLFLFCEGDIYNLHLDLRTTLSHLQTASCMTQGILRSQFPKKPTPALYKLLSSFLHRITTYPCSTTLLACFYLKVLKHEGTYSPQEEEHSFSLQEKFFLQELMHCPNFTALIQKTCSLELGSRIEHLFYQIISLD